MRAAILTEIGKPLVMDEVELPAALEAGQLFVKILYSGVCGSQIGEIQGVKGPDKYLPHLLGHEATATVLAIGPGVRTVTVGDQVILHWRKGQGIDAVPPKYSWRGKPLNAGQITTFNEYAVVSENRATRMHTTLSPKAAALLGCAVTTGIGAVENNANVRIGECVIVLGAGGVGINIIEGSSLRGAAPIVAVDLNDAKLEFAKRFGATHTVNSAKGELSTQVSQLLEGRKPDVVFETTGMPKLIEWAYTHSSPQARIILIGVPHHAENIHIHSFPLHLGKQLIGCHGGDSDPTVDIPRLERLAESGQIKLEELATEVFPFSHIQKAIDKMRAGDVVGRCVIDFAA